MGTSYDRVAASYEARFVDELSGKPRDRELLEAFITSVGDPVVDVGCGPGHVGAFVRERGRQVVGVDLSAAMAKLAGARLDAAVVADMHSLPLESRTCGGVLAFYSLIHVPRAELETVLEEFHRVLRPGGRVLFSAHEGQGEVTVDEFLGERATFVATLFGLDELVAAAEAAGLTVTIAERRAPFENEGSTNRLYVDARRPVHVPGTAAR